MSGIDELFPGAPEASNRPQRPPAQGPLWLGLLALCLGFVASALNVSALFTFFAATLSSDGASKATWAPAYETAAAVGAGLIGLAALILAVRAWRRRGGRIEAVIGGVLGALAIAADLAIAVIFRA